MEESVLQLLVTWSILAQVMRVTQPTKGKGIMTRLFLDVLAFVAMECLIERGFKLSKRISLWLIERGWVKDNRPKTDTVTYREWIL